MISFKVAVAFTTMMALVLSVPVYEEHKEIEQYAHPKYEFKYGVKDEHTHDIKEQAEKRDGDKVEGYYKLVEPDGTTRTVHYTSDKHTGFHAQVVRSGHAIHPIQQEKKIILPVKKIVLPKYEEVPLPSYSQKSSGDAESYSSFNF
ncbi:cuticle protein 19-like [Zootermopsis nevadensis]|uniref:cuticle protein 19-like n=1 Tax=Zootermopsis nevadensis TaxID=136037 RepID=UPI000B8E9459|nr:cuticle protein 19-like [Zootermopsis nevadensis]